MSHLGARAPADPPPLFAMNPKRKQGLPAQPQYGVGHGTAAAAAANTSTSRESRETPLLPTAPAPSPSRASVSDDSGVADFETAASSFTSPVHCLQMWREAQPAAQVAPMHAPHPHDSRKDGTRSAPPTEVSAATFGSISSPPMGRATRSPAKSAGVSRATVSGVGDDAGWNQMYPSTPQARPPPHPGSGGRDRALPPKTRDASCGQSTAGVPPPAPTPSSSAAAASAAAALDAVEQSSPLPTSTPSQRYTSLDWRLKTLESALSRQDGDAYSTVLSLGQQLEALQAKYDSDVGALRRENAALQQQVKQLQQAQQGGSSNDSGSASSATCAQEREPLVDGTRRRSYVL